MSTTLPAIDRARGALAGALIGDALAMPAHWYYDPRQLRATFGTIDRYLPPSDPHPGSILWRSRYEPTEPEYDILGAERAVWGMRGIHYHRHLAAGGNTLNLQLLRLAVDQIATTGTLDTATARERYVAFLRLPAGHRDTYLEECHRGFFENLRRGVAPERAAVEEKHIGGMVAVVPLYALLRARGADDAGASAAVSRFVGITHAGRLVQASVETLLVIAREVLGGTPVADVLLDHARRQDLPLLRGPLERLARDFETSAVIGPRLSPACYLDESMPATFYLAMRYHDDARRALVENTMAGGDNCHRGAVLGALIGLDRGVEAFPVEWVDGLVTPLPAIGA